VQAGKNRIFLTYLYSHYNVEDIINIDGSLYSRQGTSFDVRLILISGRKAKPEGFPPLKNDDATPITDFESLFERVSSGTMNKSKILIAKAKAKALLLIQSQSKGLGMPPKSKIVDFVVKVIGKTGNKEYLDFGEIDSDEANQLFKVTGLNFEGYKRTLDSSGINHSIKHKNISPQDFALIPKIITDYDFIGKGRKEGIIVYKKVIDNDYFYLEEVREGRKKLVIKTFYKRERRK